MSGGGPQTRRRTAERLAVWLLTGPIGHLIGFLAEVLVLWSRWVVAEAKRRFGPPASQVRSTGRRGAA